MRTYCVAFGIECPRGEVDGDTSRTSKCKGEDKDENLSTAVDGSTEQVLRRRGKSVTLEWRLGNDTYVVLPEPACAVLPDVEVRCEANDHPGIDVAVRATGEITHVVYAIRS